MRLMSKKTVAKRLAVSPKTVDRWVKAGRFPKPIILPSSGQNERETVRWDKIQVETWVELQRQTVASEEINPGQDGTIADTIGHPKKRH